MQAERWKSIEGLYEAAIALPPEKRDGFLEQACSDVQLRGEVQSLLDQQTGGFLEDSPLSLNLQKGVRLGSFEMVERIGRGGMGEVWRAKDTRLHRDVAIKLLPGAFASDPERIARFEHEARAASALNHPNVVSVFDIGSENGVYWIVSELVDGESLQRLMSKGRLSVQRAIEISAQIADGLAAAHAAGIVHRDLKPGNIMLRRDGRVKIVDFGLAKHVRPSPDSVTLTDAGVILGTAGYMSPEQVRGEPADARSDIFSFGVILYEMLAGRAAFTGASSIELMNGILKDEPAELPSSTPTGLTRTVRRCLEKQPDRRFQCSADLGFALVSSPETPAPPPKRSRLRLAWLATTAALVLAAAGLTWWFATRFQPPLWMPDATLRQLTHDAGLTVDPAISPDGKLVAYASDRADPDNLDIWVQQADGGGAVRITNDPADDEDPTFSPDASQIAFRSDREGGGIYVVPALGGEARLLVPSGRRPRFSPDGKWLMYSIGLGAQGDALYVQRLDEGVKGTGPVQIGAGCYVWLNTPVWSADSSRVLFGANCGSGHVLWLSTLDGKRIASPGTFPQNLGETEIDQWIPDPSRLLFVAGAENGSSVATLPLSEDGTKITGPMRRITFSTGSARHVSRAVNGRLAFESGDRDVHMWGIPIDGDGHATGEPGRVTSRAGDENGEFALSRDGKSLAVVRDDGLYYWNLATGKEREVLRDNNVDTAIFGPDAMTLMFSAGDPHTPAIGIYEMPALGGATKKIWNDSGAEVVLWDSAPDGMVLFAPFPNPTDPGRVFEKDMKSLSTTTFLDDPDYDVWQAHFSHDGRWVTFIAGPKEHNGRGSEVFVAPFRKALVPRSEWIPVTAGRGGDKPRFSWDDKLIFFPSECDGFRCIWAQRLGPNKHPVGEPFAVQHFHQRRRSLSNLDISDFGMAVGPKTIVFNEAEINSNIWLLNPGKSNP